MLEVMKIQDVAEELVESRVGSYTDSYNYILILCKEEGSLKSYQMCVQEIDDEKDLYISEYDLFTYEVGETYDIEDFKAYIENHEVYVISEIIEI